MPDYPNTPGFRYPDTSRQAARLAALWSSGLRLRCLIALLNRPMSANELAAFLELDVQNISPRLSELKALGLIHSEGVRRATHGTATALVWHVTRSNLPKEFTGLGQGSLFTERSH